MTKFDDTFYDKYIEEAVKVDRLSVELRTAAAVLELRGIRIKYLAQQNNILRDEILVLRDALELIRGFLINKGYSEHDPFVLGAVNKALEKQIPEGDAE